MITYDDTISWNRHPVTLALKRDLQDRLEEHSTSLAAAIDSLDSTQAYAHKAVMDTIETILTYEVWKLEETNKGE